MSENAIQECPVITTPFVTKFKKMIDEVVGVKPEKITKPNGTPYDFPIFGNVTSHFDETRPTLEKNQGLIFAIAIDEPVKEDFSNTAVVGSTTQANPQRRALCVAEVVRTAKQEGSSPHIRVLQKRLLGLESPREMKLYFRAIEICPKDVLAEREKAKAEQIKSISAEFLL